MIRAYYLPPAGKPSVALTDKEQILEVFRRKEGFLWVDMESPTPEETNFLADGFGFHPVTVETCREVTSQPLAHGFDDYLFMVIHAVNIQTRGVEVDTLEVDIFWGKQFVLTYHQVPVKSISEMRDQCEKDGERLLSRGAAFFIHAVVDKIIDNFAPTLERIEYLLEELEIQIFRNPTDRLLHELLDLKQTVLYLGRVAGAQRDVVGRLVRGEFGPVTKQAMAYWLEAYDHLLRMVYTVENYRDMITTARETYMSVVTNRTNAVIKVLTIIATVFMPITFIASLYGMNFKFMPEITWKWGYPAALLLMVVSTAWMVWFFRRRKWI
ncbi:MAG: magnesium/cobalt transporter CorA [Phycisphaerae bacterium]